MSRRIWFVYVVVAAVYLILTFLGPVDTATLDQYDITEFQLKLLMTTIILPLLAIWFAAFYGFSRFKSYAKSISGSQDGRAFDYIANGLGVLAVSLPAASILSGISTFITHNLAHLEPTMTIIRNYASIIFILVAFWLIQKGSQMLMQVSAKKKSQQRYGDAVTLLTAVLAVFYTFLIFQNPNREVPVGEVWRATYYLPDWLILTSIILPYLYVWLLGFQSVAAIINYSKSVKGTLYKQMLGLLVKGLSGIILISIATQLLINFASLFRSMSLSPLIGIIYLLLAAMALGYVYVAMGARRLQKIEEV